MTEPVTRATSVRRTVTVATVLVLSQAVLCAVIGWVTFGGKEPAHSQPRADGALLGPAIVVPPASVPPVVTPGPTHQSAKPVKERSSTPKPTAARVRLSPSAAPRRTPGEIMVAPSPPAATISAGSDLVSQPSASAPQSDVEVGKPCDPEGADGVTADDVAVRCLRDDSGDLVWQII